MSTPAMTCDPATHDGTPREPGTTARAAAAPPDWTSANQSLLVAEFARLRARLRGENDPDVEPALAAARARLIAPAAIDRIVERFALTPFERDLLLLLAGVEMDGALALLVAQASGEPRPAVSFGLALAVLAEPHWSALTPDRPLRRWRLLQPDDATALSSCRLRLDERVLHELAGISGLDPRLQPLLRLQAEPAPMAHAHRQLADALAADLLQTDAPPPLLQLWGDDGASQRDVAARVAGALGLRLFLLEVADLPASAAEQEELATLWGREAALLDAALLVACEERQPPPAMARLLERLSGLVISAGPEPLPLNRPERRQHVERPDADDRIVLWGEVLGSQAEGYGEALQAVAREFRLSPADIRRLGDGLRQPPLPAAGQAPLPEPARLWSACRAIQGCRLEGLAQRLAPRAGWEELILPEQQKAILRQIALHLRHRTTVHEHWGFAAHGGRGLGLAALFAGESGTGKTLAAEVLARELNHDLYRIDLSAVVSKYIGETEKNLSRVFDAAEDSGVILLFDEADALFGKRSEVRDSHDRYANIEVSYLLQRMEAYRGLAILTTNQKAALDPAFQRRLRFVVHFPFPEAREREAIWRGTLPAAMPTEGLDLAKLARLQVAGGTIRTIALNAAFLAAESGGPLTMAHLLGAAHADALKRERALGEAEIRGWV